MNESLGSIRPPALFLNGQNKARLQGLLHESLSKEKIPLAFASRIDINNDQDIAPAPEKIKVIFTETRQSIINDQFDGKLPRLQKEKLAIRRSPITLKQRMPVKSVRLMASLEKTLKYKLFRRHSTSPRLITLPYFPIQNKCSLPLRYIFPLLIAGEAFTSQDMKDQFMTYIGAGIANGDSASEISRDIRNMLENPDARFRRINNNGTLS